MRSYDIVQKEQDLTTLEWGERVNSSGTAGTYLKARTGHGARAIYYKLPRYNGIEFDGHECINELVAARLMRLLEIDHLEYRLIHARVVVDGRERGVWLNSSKNFRKPRERKLSLSAYVSLYGEQGATPYEVCRAHGWEGQIKQMMLVDYLIANRDRHGSNIEVILSPDGSASLRPFSTTACLSSPPSRGSGMLSRHSIHSVALPRRTTSVRVSWRTICAISLR